MNQPSQYLDSVEMHNNAVLYECRWNPHTAAEVVPQLIATLRHSDRWVLIRALNALHRIGLPAEAATTSVIPLIFHADEVVARAATITTAAVGRNKPLESLPALISASSQPELLKEVMHALIAFASKARDGTKVFTSALSHSDYRVRRLAIRGLEAIADDATLRQALERALSDRSKEVREYAQKVRKRIAHPTA